MQYSVFCQRAPINVESNETDLLPGDRFQLLCRLDLLNDEILELASQNASEAASRECMPVHDDNGRTFVREAILFDGKRTRHHIPSSALRFKELAEHRQTLKHLGPSAVCAPERIVQLIATVAAPARDDESIIVYEMSDDCDPIHSLLIGLMENPRNLLEAVSNPRSGVHKLPDT